MPRHHRRRRQPPGLSHPGSTGHACRNAERRARHRGGNPSMIRDVETLPANVDLAIVGAGPAGLAASATAARLGLSVLLLDENPGVGGQIYPHITTNPTKDHALLGGDYGRGEALAKEAAASSAQHAASAIVWSVAPLDGG